MAEAQRAHIQICDGVERFLGVKDRDRVAPISELSSMAHRLPGSPEDRCRPGPHLAGLYTSRDQVHAERLRGGDYRLPGHELRLRERGFSGYTSQEGDRLESYRPSPVGQENGRRMFDRVPHGSVIRGKGVYFFKDLLRGYPASPPRVDIIRQ